MKKLLILILLFLPIVVSAQIGRYPFYTAPVVLAPAVDNMISNGTFDTSADWDPHSCEISSGALQYHVGYCAMWQLSTDMVDSLDVSTDYNLSFDVVSVGIIIRVQSYPATIIISETTYTTGHYSIDFTTPGTLAGYGFSFSNWNSANVGSIDNVILVKR